MRSDARPLLVLGLLAGLAVVSVVCFMTLGVKGNWGFVLQFRGRKLLSLILVAWSVAVSTALFQTVTNNRILTPSIMGFDALFILVQTIIMFFFGTAAFSLMNPWLQFGMETVLLSGFAAGLFGWLFLGAARSLHLVVLIGLIFGIFFRSLANFMQRLLDPNAFQVLQDSFFASFSTVDTSLLGLCWAVVLAISFGLWRIGHTLDVLSLDRAAAIGLGVNYRRTVMLIVLACTVLVAVSTALVGPITFFGLLVVSLAHALVGNGRHRWIIPASVLLGVICLVGGQTLLERVFAFDTALSIIIEFLGGIVFILLVVRGAAR